jgi:glycosyltransferase involved in cell wall biosynthesis
MKILIISDYFQPKIGYAKVQVARNLMILGHEVKILTSDRYFQFHNYETTTKKLIGKRIRKVGTKTENNFLVERLPIYAEFFSRVILKGLENSIKGFKPDLVILYGISTYTSYKVAKLKSKYNYKLSIADSHLPSELNTGNQFIKKIIYFTFRLLFSKTISVNADKVIALQDKTKEVINDTYGLDNKVEVIPNGTDTTLFKLSKVQKNIIRKELNINSDDFVIIYTGKFIKQKGLDILFNAFNSLKSRHKVHLILLAEGPKDYIKSCFSLLSKNKIANVHLIGFKDQIELYKYYSASDLAVWPLQESLAMNDAAACSLPFIANSTMGDKSRISNNNAFLYEIDNVKDLKKKIEILIKDKPLRIKMGKNGRQLMIEKLSWKKIAKRYI